MAGCLYRIPSLQHALVCFRASAVRAHWRLSRRQSLLEVTKLVLEAGQLKTPLPFLPVITASAVPKGLPVVPGGVLGTLFTVRQGAGHILSRRLYNTRVVGLLSYLLRDLEALQEFFDWRMRLHFPS